MKKMLAVFFATLVLLFSTAVPTAAGQNSVSLSIPAQTELYGKSNAFNAKVALLFEADDPSYPMPAGSNGSSYLMTVKIGEKQSFPAVEYSQTGVYTYKISPAKSGAYSASDQAYNVKVYVTSEQNGKLAVNAVMLDQKGKKADSADFAIRFPEKVNSPDTGVQYYSVFAGVTALPFSVAFAGVIMKIKKKKSKL